VIPYKLRLRNFMCYREEQSLDFSGIHLACLAGDNGHGKSALLDAITWALWGRARAQRDDDLITLGRDVTDMWVEFEFGLGPHRYRVWRQRSKKGRGQSDLHLYVWNDGDSDWQLLDEGGLRERQAQITRTLRMEYETFVNSAFLLQGKADSFTVKTASERKQILADILGLSRYDGYEARAKEEVQARRDQAGRIQGEIDAIERDLTRRGEYEVQLRSAQATAAAAIGTLRTAEAEQSRCRLVLQECRVQARQLADLEARLARSERDLSEDRQQLATARTQLAQLEAVLAQQMEIEEGWAALQMARDDEATWNDRLLHNTRLQEAAGRAQLAVDQARLELEGKRRRLSERHEELGRRVAKGHEQAEVLAQAQAVLARLAALETRRDAINAELRQVGERAAMLRTENDRLKSEGQAAREKIALLAEVEAAACPLCGQPLEAARRDQMLADFQAERDALASRYQANLSELKVSTDHRAGLEAEDSDLARELRVKDARQRQAAQADTAVLDGQSAAEEQRGVAEEIAALDVQLEAAGYASAERAELARLQAELVQVGYDNAEHERVRGRLRALEPFAARYQRQLLPALDAVPDARTRADLLAVQVSRREAELAEDQIERNRLATIVANLPALEVALDRAIGEVDNAVQAERRARQEEGAAMQQLDALASLAEKRVQRLADLAVMNAEISIYNQLREAFGKKGLQAMIIESAIPEVETEANRLLSRMSEGRMNLRLETQREKVTGGVAETLDIIISDELGARPYETFSGGESFRANLALRIAISKLLARRAGAQLQTLVIDEGFGSQDSQGRLLVVEAINSIQQDFERIIVITHIEELRDLFPARIDVIKTAEGARVSIA
jgi:exonuclease SbcC